MTTKRDKNVRKACDEIDRWCLAINKLVNKNASKLVINNTLIFTELIKDNTHRIKRTTWRGLPKGYLIYNSNNNTWVNTGKQTKIYPINKEYKDYLQTVHPAFNKEYRREQIEPFEKIHPGSAKLYDVPKTKPSSDNPDI